MGNTHMEGGHPTPTGIGVGGRAWIAETPLDLAEFNRLIEYDFKIKILNQISTDAKSARKGREEGKRRAKKASTRQTQPAASQTDHGRG
jgi:hypothetical protein